AEHPVKGRKIECDGNSLRKCVEMAVALAVFDSPDAVPVVVYPNCEELKERLPFKHICVQPEHFPCGLS
ncbi:MAG: hypothetical protein ACP5I3_10740, partial [Thermoproteus sp.]